MIGARCWALLTRKWHALHNRYELEPETQNSIAVSRNEEHDRSSLDIVQRFNCAPVVLQCSLSQVRHTCLSHYGTTTTYARFPLLRITFSIYGWSLKGVTREQSTRALYLSLIPFYGFPPYKNFAEWITSAGRDACVRAKICMYACVCMFVCVCVCVCVWERFLKLLLLL